MTKSVRCSMPERGMLISPARSHAQYARKVVSMAGVTESSKAVHTKQWWDEKARSFYEHERRTYYADSFLCACGIQPAETVFDMGCGSGTLCVPLADEGHKVICADFSEGQLDTVREVIETEDLGALLEPLLLDWEEDWDLRSLPVCDIAVASRAIFGDGLPEKIAKLTGRARRRVCISLPLGHRHCGEVGGRVDSAEELQVRMDTVCQAVAAVFALGYLPEVSYLSMGEGEELSWCFIAWNLGDRIG